MEGRRESMITRKPVPSATVQPVGAGYHIVNPVETDTRINGQDNAILESRTRGSVLWSLFWDSVLVIPGVAFLVYGILVAVNAGKDITEKPIPALRSASGYGPTIFPIAFAAVAANVLKSYAAWKLERGISLLHLEYLLSSRTVFSAFMAPFSLRTWNVLVPLLLALWALSPLGGQAALRVMTVVPSTASEAHSFQWLEFMSRFPHGGPGSSAGADLMPPAAGAFSAALSSPMSIKTAPRDVFGNVKIPMVEVYQASDKTEADAEGWYVVDSLPDDDGVRYSSIAGLPLTSQDDLSQKANYSLTIDTSYLYTTCSVSHTTGTGLADWVEMRNKTITSSRTFYNERTLVLSYGNVHTMFSDTPLEMIFTSWTSQAITNATCSFSMSYVQAELSCHVAECEATRLRSVPRAANVTVQTVLDGLNPDGERNLGIAPQADFFTSFVEASLTYWEKEWRTDQYSTPIEYYFTNPASPYSAARTGDSTWRGADIYPIGDALFSYRFSQLLNTFWIVSIAPFAASSGLTFNATLAAATEWVPLMTPRVANAVGTMTPDILVMRPHTAWLVVLLVSAAVMTAAAVAGATLGALREGPDVLERATSFLAYEQRAGGLVRADTADAAAWKRQQVRLPRAVSSGNDAGWMKG
ncbi:hypothetical protein F5X68DRAFT_15643 [Plectosphaerella plurivora]|uniref:Uncharacterized protein n=1 Tax=Plectosphaerella plurivora TaxID=936078 RepID=A0A9P8VCE8_9PEZI|nr:hypothetical protein F5X68DRAFT_15643 [Plectosphaerella plurivora]